MHKIVQIRKSVVSKILSDKLLGQNRIIIPEW